MSLFADLRSTRTPGATIVSWQQAIRLLLVMLVLAGGIYPPLYQGQLPHTHIFVGGPPPADWEDHQHENPLDYLFGPVTSGTPSDTAATTASGTTDPRAPVWASGHVVSVYTSAGSVLVFTVLAYAVMTPLHRRSSPTQRTFQVARSRLDLSPQTTPRPVTPPPRTPDTS